MMGKPKMTALKIMIGSGKGEEGDMPEEEMCKCPKCGHEFSAEDSSYDEEEDMAEEEMD